MKRGNFRKLSQTPGFSARLFLNFCVFFISCDFPAKNDTCSLTVSIPARSGKTALNRVSTLRSAMFDQGTAIKKNIIYESEDTGDSEEVVIFTATLAGPDYYVQKNLDEGYFETQSESIEKSGHVTVKFDNVPRGEKLIINITAGKVLWNDRRTYPLGAFQIIRSESTFKPSRSSESLTIAPVAGLTLPMVRMASLVGKLTGCRGKLTRTKCDFVPFRNRSADFNFCTGVNKYLKPFPVQKLPETTSPKKTSIPASSLPGKEPETTPPEPLDEDDTGDEHFIIDSEGHLNAEIFSGEPIRFFVIDDNGQMITLLPCNYTIPIPSDETSSHVWNYHMVVFDGEKKAHLMTTRELWNRLTPEARFRLFPGHAGNPGSLPYTRAWGDDISDLDRDGISDKMELSEIHSSPLHRDPHFSTAMADAGFWIDTQSIVYETDGTIGFQFWIEGKLELPSIADQKRDELLERCMKIFRASEKKVVWLPVKSSTCALYLTGGICENHHCWWNHKNRKCSSVGPYYFNISASTDALYKVSFSDNYCGKLSSEECDKDSVCRFNPEIKSCETSCHSLISSCNSSSEKGCTMQNTATCNRRVGCIYVENEDQCRELCEHVSPDMEQFVYVPLCHGEECRESGDEK